MQVSVTFRNMEPKDVLRNYAQEKISKLERFVDHPLEGKVVLVQEKHRQLVEAALAGRRKTLNAREEADDMFAAIDLVTEKLERQILKKKEKNKRGRFILKHPRREPLGDTALMVVFDEEADGKILKRKKARIENLSVYEAVRKMDSRKDNILAFEDDEKKNLNILHRRQDGFYDLIELEI